MVASPFCQIDSESNPFYSSDSETFGRSWRHCYFPKCIYFYPGLIMFVNNSKGRTYIIFLPPPAFMPKGGGLELTVTWFLAWRLNH